MGSGGELQILGRTLAPLARYELVLDALTLVEGAEPRCLDRRDVDESIRSPLSGVMKPKPLVALNHFTVPVGKGSSLPSNE
jgi:hypothetical protein